MIILPCTGDIASSNVLDLLQLLHFIQSIDDYNSPTA